MLGLQGFHLPEHCFGAKQDITLFPILFPVGFFFPQNYLNTEIPASYPNTTLKTVMLSLHTLQMAWELLCETECLYHMLNTLDGLQNSYSIAGAEYSTPV